MKKLVWICITCLWIISIKTNAQDDLLEKKITINAKNKTVVEILDEVAEKYNINISYDPEIFSDKKITVDVKEEKLKNFLIRILGEPFDFKIINNQLIIFKKSDDRRTQTIKGRVIDMDSDIPLTGATIIVNSTSPQLGTVTDRNGYFSIPGVPIGRQTITASFVGYKKKQFDDILIISAKETILTIELEESVQEIDEVKVTATIKSEPLNEMATVSARSFTIEETEKYAGSLGDPARMAANFAGVFTAGDQRNDIIIRGNAPTGLIWRLEDIPIPSPNHFDELGTNGGAISMLNNNLLKKSDFFTGTFPAEYGNGTSGVFDLKLRNGNYEKTEFLAQLGFNGFEFGMEGPISKRTKSSYLINVRYSMLELVGELLWVEGMPHYKDITFKFNFPLSKGNLSFFGLGGISKISMEDTIYSSENITRIVRNTPGSKTGVTGMRWMHFFNQDLRMINTISVSTRRPFNYRDSISDEGNDKNIRENLENENRLAISSKLIKKFNSKNTADIGILMENTSLDYHYKDYEYYFNNDSMVYDNPFTIEEKNLVLLQGYLEWKHKFSDNVSVNSGIHYSHFLYNNTFSIEPRVGLKWQYSNSRSINFGYGMHSQLQPYLYYVLETRTVEEGSQNEVLIQTNKNLDFSKSHQLVLGHDYSISSNLHLKVEAYYEYLYNIPVEKRKSYFSMINYRYGGETSDIDSLVNKGTGRNYGIEMTFEKFLSQGYYFLITGSLFDSKYRGSDNILRNTAFNGNYVFNALGGYEWKVGKHSSLNVNIRGVYAGGMRSVPLNMEQTILQGGEVYSYDHAFELQQNEYFRLDGRISFLFQGKKVTQEIAFDLSNMTNHKNEYARYYSPVNKNIEIQYQQGIFPMGLYRINF
jgi:hypothetical protein